jgi:hypothetical protein
MAAAMPILRTATRRERRLAGTILSTSRCAFANWSRASRTTDSSTGAESCRESVLAICDALLLPSHSLHVAAAVEFQKFGVEFSREAIHASPGKLPFFHAFANRSRAHDRFRMDAATPRASPRVPLMKSECLASLWSLARVRCGWLRTATLFAKSCNAPCPCESGVGCHRAPVSKLQITAMPMGNGLTPEAAPNPSAVYFVWA